MCNGHKFVKSSLFRSPSYLMDLSPYISAVITSKFISAPIQFTANALVPIAKSILPLKASNFILSGTLTCEYCLHQVYQSSFDDGRPCPKQLANQLGYSEAEYILADDLLDRQDKFYRSHQTQTQINQSTNLNASNADQSQQKSVMAISHTDSITSSTASSSANNPNSEPLSNPTPGTSSGTTTTPSSSSSSSHKTASSTALSTSSQFAIEPADRYKNDLLIMQICPEIGLHGQQFKCVDCDKKINLSSARLCHYDGRYYCCECHSNSLLVPIPAQILHNWDFSLRPVSKTSWHKICYIRTRPVLFNLFQINSRLYGFIDKLVDIKHMRENIRSMLDYINVCGQPDKPCLSAIPKHFLDDSLGNLFSLSDLLDINQVFSLLSGLRSTLEVHITKSCESCAGKGHYCELCRGLHEVLYPFDTNAICCNICGAVYHKNCYHRKKKNCPKCLRQTVKRISIQSDEAVSLGEQIKDKQNSSSTKATPALCN